MKIKQLRIEGFGKLVNQTYDLEDFTTFLGENEAGKSTILALLSTCYLALKMLLLRIKNSTL